MNPELSSIIDQALQYASPLPVSRSIESSVHEDTRTSVTAGELSHPATLQTVQVPMAISVLDSNSHCEIENPLTTLNTALFTTANSTEPLPDFVENSSANFHDMQTEMPDAADVCHSVPLFQDYLGYVVNVTEPGSTISHMEDSIAMTSNSSLEMPEEITSSSASMTQLPVYTTCSNVFPAKEEVVEDINTERPNDILRDFSLFCDKIQSGLSEQLDDKHMQMSLVNSSIESSPNSSMHSILTSVTAADVKNIVTAADVKNISCSVSASTSCPSANSSWPSANSSCSSASVPKASLEKPKRKRKREFIPDRIPCVTVLPPCRICDDKSSGYHYGANTCEACKGFFRRTLKKREITFACKCTDEEKGAWQRGPLKNGCPACRYERCLAVGMSKNAIKIGRYTLNRKTENIKEVKSLEAMDVIIESAIEKATMNSSPGSGGTDISYLGLNSPEDFPLPLSVGELMAENESSDKLQIAESSDAVSKRLSLKEKDTIVKNLTAAQTMIEEMEKSTKIPKDQLLERQARYLEGYNMKQEMFGTLPALSREEYFDFYKATGIDVDGRKEKLDAAFSFFEKKISIIVEFAKHIPGFRSLSLQDQASLVKASRCESILIGCHRLVYESFNMDMQVGTTPWGKEFHMSEVGTILPIELLQNRRMYAQRFAELHLTKQEEALVRAITIMFSDRCELEEPERVQHHQEMLMECLEHVLSLRPGGPGNLLYRIVSFMMSIREHTNMDADVIKKRIVNWPIADHFQLVKEFIG